MKLEPLRKVWTDCSPLERALLGVMGAMGHREVAARPEVSFDLDLVSCAQDLPALCDRLAQAYGFTEEPYNGFLINKPSEPQFQAIIDSVLDAFVEERTLRLRA